MCLTKVLECLLLRYTAKLSENLDVTTATDIRNCTKNTTYWFQVSQGPNEADSQEKPIDHVSSHF